MATHKCKTSSNKTKKGFSLVEVVVSAALFVLVWLVLAGNIMVGKACEARSRHHVQAAYFAQSYTEQVLRQIPFATLTAMRATNPNQANIVVGAENAATQFNAVRSATVGATVNNGASPMYTQVEVDIQWNESPVIGGVTQQHEYVITIIPNDPVGN